MDLTRQTSSSERLGFICLSHTAFGEFGIQRRIGLLSLLTVFLITGHSSLEVCVKPYYYMGI